MVDTSISFDEYAESYDAALNQGLSATGESKDYFAHGRVQWLGRCLREIGEHPRGLMDYGCGDGSSSEFLLNQIGGEWIVGVDTSEKLLELANQNYLGKRCSFCPMTKYEPKEELDLVYCNGVFHHIPPAERSYAAAYIWRSLRPGGLFALWENNPWNPGTRYVMSRIPFDRNAITLTPREASGLLRKAGFEVLRRDSLFFFPKQLKWFRWMETYLSALPLGGQYQILSRRC
jgi:SAM-dependent methyltransferase